MVPKFLPGPLSWSEADAVTLRDFLLTATGQNLVRSLVQMRPLVNAREGERRRIEQDERTGHESCINDILTLADPTQHFNPTQA